MTSKGLESSKLNLQKSHARFDGHVTQLLGGLFADLYLWTPAFVVQTEHRRADRAYPEVQCLDVDERKNDHGVLIVPNGNTKFSELENKSKMF